jgi:hypothetical protein
MNFRLLFGFFLLLLVCSTVVCGEWVDPWVRKNVTSQRDAFFIDMPSVVHRMEPVTITLTVNDPVVRAEANAVEVNPDNNNFYSVGKRLVREPSGGIRTIIPYSGESTLTVGFKSNDIWTNEFKVGSTPTVYFGFYKVKTPSGTGYPDTVNVSSEYYGYQCNSYYKGYFCPQGDCLVCVKALAIVWKEYELLPARASGTPPAGYNWVDDRTTSPFSADLLKNPAYLGYSFSDPEKVVPGQFNMLNKPITCPDTYVISLDSPLQMDTDFARMLSDYQRYNKDGIASGKTTVSAVNGPGGVFSGKAVEIVAKDSGSSQWDWYSVSYEMFADETPENNGIGHLKMSRSGCTEKGGAKAVMDKSISDVKKFAASYSVQYEGSPNSGFVPQHYYDLLRRETGKSISGKITDGNSLPMPYMTVSVEYEGNNYDGRTDEGGNYDIKVPLLEFDQNNPKMGTLRY